MSIDILQSDIPIVRQVVAACYSFQVKHIVISPGSRNAPLAISFSNNPYFKCYSIVDERCAGFFAMGIAQQLKEPVALVCTSGSALLNYYPAISEAFYSQIPLIILSADRPKKFIDIGDGQTIRQSNVYQNHVVDQVDLSNAFEYNLELEEENQELLNNVISKSITKELPSHINIPIYEPLYNRVKSLVEVKFNCDLLTKKESFSIPKSVLDKWGDSKKILVLVGVLSPNTIEQKYLDILLNNPAVVMITETTSNLYHPKIINGIDKLIAAFDDNEKHLFQPEVLLTFGGMVVSKKIKALLRAYQPKVHWHIDEHRAYDTYFCLTEHYKTSINSFLAQLPLEYKKETNYQEYWLNEFTTRRKGHDLYLSKIPYCDLKVYGEIFNRLESHICLQLSNSSTIRYSQLFDISNNLEVFCNRGTSGIDGSTSTAIGAALVQEKPTLLITGDLSFLYDSNALWNNYTPNNFKIIIINNSGGGIFRILPGDKSAKYFEEFLETKHQYTAEHLSKMYGYTYIQGDGNNFIDSIERFVENKTKTILEIFTPNNVNDEILLAYFKEIRQIY